MPDLTGQDATFFYACCVSAKQDMGVQGAHRGDYNLAFNLRKIPLSPEHVI